MARASRAQTNAMCLILTDSIESKKERGFDSAPLSNLLNNLVRYLCRTLPSLSVKTGYAGKATLAMRGLPNGLEVALNVAQGGA